MHFRKFIFAWALLALMIGQFSLAQHSAVHIDHGFSTKIIASHDGHEDHQNDPKKGHLKHQCPECLLTKSLQTAFYNAPVTFVIGIEKQSRDLFKQSSAIVDCYFNPNSPRAPPVFLI